MSGNRQQLIDSAVTFLRDPSTSNSGLAQRIAFLESKGLTPPEIEQALAQASSPNNGGYLGNSNGSSAGMTRSDYRRLEYERDWRDWFIMGVISGSVGWLALKLAHKFILPHLQPPNQTELEQVQKALEAKYDEASALLNSLQTSTDSLVADFEEQRKEVESDLVEVRKAVEDLREGEKKREEWAKKIGEQVDEVVKGLPNMLDKQATSQAQSLTDLQAELKSLKSLLIARRPNASSSPNASLLSPSTSAPNLGAYVTPLSSGASEPVASSASVTRSPILGARAPGIPSWQLKNSSAAGLASSAASTLPGTSYKAVTPTVGTPTNSSLVNGESTKENSSSTDVEVILSPSDNNSASGGPISHNSDSSSLVALAPNQVES